MAKSDLKVTIDAEAAKLEREIERTNRAMQRMESQIRRTELEAARLNKELDDRRARAMENFGRGLLVFGAAVAAGLGLAAKAAIDWESSWAGVLKTVEGSPEQLARLEDELRGLATTLPATHGEIAAVAEAAGQLGIATNDVAEFTRIMIMLGETTNLSATEAATALARFMNIMGTAPGDVDRLGAAIVDLGNNAETTEAEITEMALRIAGTGATIGLTEADVLALATAMSSVGIRAEAGGTAISRVMSDIASAVASGGEAVSGFADVAGMSASEFATAFEQDPARAIQSFIEGLGRIDETGGNVFGTLDNLGLGGIRVRDVLLRLSQASGILNENLDRSADAWESNTALVEEAERRFDTTEAKIQIAKNALVDLGIDIGSVLLPAIAGLAEGAASILRAFGDLPGPIKTVVTILAALVGTASLAGGAFLLLAPRIAAARAEMQLLAPAGSRAAGALGALGRAAGVAGAVVAVVGVLEMLHQASVEAGASVGEMTEALLALRRGDVTEAIDTLIEKRDKLADRSLWAAIATNLTSFGSGMAGVRHDADEFANEIESVDSALVSMVQSGDVDAAEQSVAALGAQLGLSGAELDAWVERNLPQYLDALAGMRADNELTAESMEPIDQGLVDLATRFGLTGEDAEKAAQEMLDAWSDAASEFFSFTDAYDTALAAKEEAERETAEATADATSDQSDSWEDFIGDVTLSVDEYLAELERQVQAQQEWENNLLTIAGRVPNEMFNELVAMGPAGADAVALFAEMTDEELQQAAEAWGITTGAGAQAITDRLAEAAPVLQQIAAQMGEDVAMAIRDEMIANGGNVFDAAQRLGIEIDDGIGIDRKREVPVGPFLEGNDMDSVRRGLNNLTLPRSVTITANLVSGDIGNLLAGRGLHSGGEITASGIRRFHGGGMFHDERLIMAQTGERILSRSQNQAWNDMADALSRLMPSMPVLPSGLTRGGDGNGGGRFTGDLYLSSGEFLGVVDGRVDQRNSERDRTLGRRVRSGTGRAR